MNTSLFLAGFGFGTFKFLFAHWMTFGAAASIGYQPHYYEIFISVTAGAWVSGAIFYFASELIMKAATKKRHEKHLTAKAAGIALPHKKRFTHMNKAVVKLKRSIGIYGLTLIAPLFLSVPFGSVVCAKFFGHEKKTFPLMMFFMASYSALMCFLIYLV